MNREQQINQQLYEKMRLEQRNFVEELKLSSPEKIIEKAYELVIREDILLSLEGDELPFEKAKALNNTKYPLSAVYDEWISNDYSHMEMIRDTLSDCADFYFKEQRSEKKKTEVER